MDDIKQVEQEYKSKRQEIERDYQIKLQELAEDNPRILGDIRYEGRDNEKIAKLLKQEYEDDLAQLEYDKVKEFYQATLPPY